MIKDKDYGSVDVVVLISSGYDEMGIYRDLTTKGYTYKQDLSGYLKTLGYVSGRPVCVAPLIHEIGGVNVLHVEATSQLVDWKMIYDWVKSVVPKDIDVFDNPTNMIVNFHHYVKKVSGTK